MRKAQIEQGLPQKYNGQALSLSAEEVENNLKSNVPYVIRMKIPDTGNLYISRYVTW